MKLTIKDKKLLNDWEGFAILISAFTFLGIVVAQLWVLTISESQLLITEPTVMIDAFILMVLYIVVLVIVVFIGFVCAYLMYYATYTIAPFRVKYIRMKLRYDKRK